MAIRERKNGSTNFPMLFLLVQSADHITGLTGATPTVTLSKNGAAFAACAGAVTEVGSGWYSLAGNATDRNTTGALILHVTATSGDPTDEKYTIVQYDPFLIFDSSNRVDIGLWLGQTVQAAVNGFPKVDLTYVLGTILTEGAAGRLAAAIIKFFNVAAPTGTSNSLPDAVAGAANGLAIVGSNMGTVTTATNLTNAPTAGDFTATMKTSLNAATPASVVGSVGSVAGNVGGSVNSVTNDVGITQVAADKVWGSTTRTLTAFGFTVSISLSAANILAIWNQLKSDAGIIANSFGALLRDNLPGASAPTVVQIDTQLSATHGAGLWGGAAGTGFYTVEIPCEVNGVPADGVQVRVTNDFAGANVVAQAISDTNGTAVVYLDAGTYYAFLQRGGDTFPNPTTLTIP